MLQILQCYKKISNINDLVFFLEKRYFTTISMGACVSFLDNEPICSKKKKKERKIP